MRDNNSIRAYSSCSDACFSKRRRVSSVACIDGGTESALGTVECERDLCRVSSTMVPATIVKYLDRSSPRKARDIPSAHKPHETAECLDYSCKPSPLLNHRRSHRSHRRQGSEPPTGPRDSAAEVIGALTAGVLTCRRNAFSMDTLPMRRAMKNGELVYWKRSASEVQPVIRAIQTWKRGFRRKQSEAASALQSVARNAKDDETTVDIKATTCSSSHGKPIPEETVSAKYRTEYLLVHVAMSLVTKSCIISANNFKVIY